MKATNLDFVISELTVIMDESLIEEGIAAPIRVAIREKFRRGVQNEYKYLLRGPK